MRLLALSSRCWGNGKWLSNCSLAVGKGRQGREIISRPFTVCLGYSNVSFKKECHVVFFNAHLHVFCVVLHGCQSNVSRSFSFFPSLIFPGLVAFYEHQQLPWGCPRASVG